MSSHIACILIDDEKEARDILKDLIKEELPEVQVLASVDNAEEALQMIINQQPELVFLDVQMPEHNGFWLANKLKGLDSQTAIIFTTAYDEFAIEAIRHSAFDYLLKPISSEELKNTIKNYCEYRNKYNLQKKIDDLKSYLSSDRIRFNTLEGFVMINLSSIIYTEAEGNYTRLFLSNGNVELVTMQLHSIEEKLPESKFIRINRSNIINIDYISSYNRKRRKIILYDILQKFEFSVSKSGNQMLMKL